MDINFEYYKVFYHVATEGSMTAAAKKLGLDQPNVSRIIKKLEYELGFELFSRENRILTLTKHGHEVFTKIRPAIFQLEFFQSQLETTQLYSQDKISISCSNTAFHYLNPQLKEFKDNHPKLNISMNITTSKDALSLINDEKMDISFVALPQKPKYPFVSEKLFELKDILCVGQKLKPLTLCATHLEDLKDMDFILPSNNTMLREHIEAFFHFHNFKPRSITEVPRVDQIAYMVAQDWGIGFLPDFCVEKIYINSNITKIPIKEELLPRSIYLVSKAGHQRSPITIDLVNSIYYQK